VKRAVWVSMILFFTIAFSFGQDVSRLLNVKKIYIGDLGREEGSDLVREKIRVRLMKTDRFVVVEKPELADAVLTGVAGVERQYTSSVSTDSNGKVSGEGTTTFAGLGVLRLVDVKTSEAIWLFEYKRGFGFKGASSRVADQTVGKLLKDVKAAKQRKP